MTINTFRFTLKQSKLLKCNPNINLRAEAMISVSNARISLCSVRGSFNGFQWVHFQIRKTNLIYVLHVHVQTNLIHCQCTEKRRSAVRIWKHFIWNKRNDGFCYADAEKVCKLNCTCPRTIIKNLYPFMVAVLHFPVRVHAAWVKCKKKSKCSTC